MRLYLALLLFLATLTFAAAQTPTPTNTPVSPRALPVSPSDLANNTAPDTQMPLAANGGLNIHWYGHGFVFLTSSVGVRAAIDPYGPQTVQYKFPVHLAADFVLISHESEDHGAADQLFGNPLIFRSVTAVGLNRANGIPFRGVALQLDPGGHGGADTAFHLSFDGVSISYLGQISVALSPQESTAIGQTDVLFLPVGLTTLSVAELNQAATDLGAKIIIPINYKTDRSGTLPLRSLDDYLAENKFPVRHIDSSEIIVSRTSLPATPTVYVLKTP